MAKQDSRPIGDVNSFNYLRTSKRLPKKLYAMDSGITRTAQEFLNGQGVDVHVIPNNIGGLHASARPTMVVSLGCLPTDPIFPKNSHSALTRLIQRVGDDYDGRMVSFLGYSVKKPNPDEILAHIRAGIKTPSRSDIEAIMATCTNPSELVAAERFFVELAYYRMAYPSVGTALKWQAFQRLVRWYLGTLYPVGTESICLDEDEEAQMIIARGYPLPVGLSMIFPTKRACNNVVIDGVSAKPLVVPFPNLTTAGTSEISKPMSAGHVRHGLVHTAIYDSATNKPLCEVDVGIGGGSFTPDMIFYDDSTLGRVPIGHGTVVEVKTTCVPITATMVWKTRDPVGMAVRKGLIGVAAYNVNFKYLIAVGGWTGARTPANYSVSLFEPYLETVEEMQDGQVVDVEVVVLRNRVVFLTGENKQGHWSTMLRPNEPGESDEKKMPETKIDMMSVSREAGEVVFTSHQRDLELMNSNMDICKDYIMEQNAISIGICKLAPVKDFVARFQAKTQLSLGEWMVYHKNKMVTDKQTITNEWEGSGTKYLYRSDAGPYQEFERPPAVRHDFIRTGFSYCAPGDTITAKLEYQLNAYATFFTEKAKAVLNPMFQALISCSAYGQGSKCVSLGNVLVERQKITYLGRSDGKKLDRSEIDLAMVIESIFSGWREKKSEIYLTDRLVPAERLRGRSTGGIPPAGKLRGYRSTPIPEDPEYTEDNLNILLEHYPRSNPDFAVQLEKLLLGQTEAQPSYLKGFYNEIFMSASTIADNCRSIPGYAEAAAYHLFLLKLSEAMTLLPGTNERAADTTRSYGMVVDDMGSNLAIFKRVKGGFLMDLSFVTDELGKEAWLLMAGSRKNAGYPIWMKEAGADRFVCRTKTIFMTQLAVETSLLRFPVMVHALAGMAQSGHSNRIMRQLLPEGTLRGFSDPLTGFVAYHRTLQGCLSRIGTTIVVAAKKTADKAVHKAQGCSPNLVAYKALMSYSMQLHDNLNDTEKLVSEWVVPCSRTIKGNDAVTPEPAGKPYSKTNDEAGKEALTSAVAEMIAYSAVLDQRCTDYFLVEVLTTARDEHECDAFLRRYNLDATSVYLWRKGDHRGLVKRQLGMISIPGLAAQLMKIPRVNGVGFPFGFLNSVAHGWLMPVPDFITKIISDWEEGLELNYFSYTTEKPRPHIPGSGHATLFAARAYSDDVWKEIHLRNAKYPAGSLLDCMLNPERANGYKSNQTTTGLGANQLPTSSALASEEVIARAKQLFGDTTVVSLYKAALAVALDFCERLKVGGRDLEGVMRNHDNKKKLMKDISWILLRVHKISDDKCDREFVVKTAAAIMTALGLDMSPFVRPMEVNTSKTLTSEEIAAQLIARSASILDAKYVFALDESTLEALTAAGDAENLTDYIDMVAAFMTYDADKMRYNAFMTALAQYSARLHKCIGGSMMNFIVSNLQRGISVSKKGLRELSKNLHGAGMRTKPKLIPGSARSTNHSDMQYEEKKFLKNFLAYFQETQGYPITDIEGISCDDVMTIILNVVRGAEEGDPNAALATVMADAMALIMEEFTKIILANYGNRRFKGYVDSDGSVSNFTLTEEEEVAGGRRAHDCIQIVTSITGDDGCSKVCLPRYVAPGSKVLSFDVFMSLFHTFMAMAGLPCSPDKSGLSMSVTQGGVHIDPHAVDVAAANKDKILAGQVVTSLSDFKDFTLWQEKYNLIVMQGMAHDTAAAIMLLLGPLLRFHTFGNMPQRLLPTGEPADLPPNLSVYLTGMDAQSQCHVWLRDGNDTRANRHNILAAFLDGGYGPNLEVVYGHFADHTEMKNTTGFQIMRSLRSMSPMDALKACLINKREVIPPGMEHVGKNMRKIWRLGNIRMSTGRASAVMEAVANKTFIINTFGKAVTSVDFRTNRTVVTRPKKEQVDYYEKLVSCVSYSTTDACDTKTLVTGTATSKDRLPACTAAVALISGHTPGNPQKITLMDTESENFVLAMECAEKGSTAFSLLKDGIASIRVAFVTSSGPSLDGGLQLRGLYIMIFGAVQKKRFSATSVSRYDVATGLLYIAEFEDLIAYLRALKHDDPDENGPSTTLLGQILEVATKERQLTLGSLKSWHQKLQSTSSHVTMRFKTTEIEKGQTIVDVFTRKGTRGSIAQLHLVRQYHGESLRCARLYHKACMKDEDTANFDDMLREHRDDIVDIRGLVDALNAETRPNIPAYAIAGVEKRVTLSRGVNALSLPSTEFMTFQNTFLSHVTHLSSYPIVARHPYPRLVMEFQEDPTTSYTVQTTVRLFPNKAVNMMNADKADFTVYYQYSEDGVPKISSRQANGLAHFLSTRAPTPCVVSSNDTRVLKSYLEY